MSKLGGKMTAKDFTRLQDCACFNIRKSSRMITQLFDQALKPSGIKATQFTLLGTLAKEGETAIKELARSLCIDRTTLSRGIVRLETKGLIKSREGDDARKRFVALTTKGIQKLNDTIPYWEMAQDVIEKRMGGNFPEFLNTLETAVERQPTSL